MKNGWVTKSLGDVCTLRNGRAYKKSELLENGKYRVLRVGNFFTNKHWYYSDLELDDTKYCDKGDLLYAWSASFGPRIWSGAKVIYHYHIWRVDFDKKNIHKKFLYYWFLWDAESIKKDQGAGTTMIHVSMKSMNARLIDIPPLEEQKHIVTILDEAFAGIDTAIANTEKNLANARELFESYLNSVFEHEGEGWITKTLGEIGKVSMCKRILKKQTTASGDIPFYKIGTFGKVPNAFISADLYQDFKEKYSFPKKGDVLISASGTIGRRVIYDGAPAYFQDSNIVWIDNDESLVLNEYLYQFYGVCDWNPSKGATISRLYNDDLRKIKISFPSIAKQKKLIETMRELDSQTQNLEAIYQNKLSALVELKQSMLQKAFSGELTADKSKLMDNAVA